MHMQLNRIRLLLLLVAFTLAVAGFFPIASTAATELGPCGDMGCPGGPNFCDYLPDGRECNCDTDNCQPENE